MAKMAGEDMIVAVTFVALLITGISFALMWFDIWKGAKLISQISAVVGVGGVMVGLFVRLISRNNDSD